MANWYLPNDIRDLNIDFIRINVQKKQRWKLIKIMKCLHFDGPVVPDEQHISAISSILQSTALEKVMDNEDHQSKQNVGSIEYGPIGSLKSLKCA